MFTEREVPDILRLQSQWMRLQILIGWNRFQPFLSLPHMLNLFNSLYPARFSIFQSAGGVVLDTTFTRTCWVDVIVAVS